MLYSSLVSDLQAKCLWFRSVLKSKGQTKSVPDSFLEFFGRIWWHFKGSFCRELLILLTWLLGTSFIFHDSHNSGISVTYPSPSIGKMYKLWNLFKPRPDYMPLFTAYKIAVIFSCLLLHFFFSSNLFLQGVQEEEKPNKKQGSKSRKKRFDGNWEGGVHMKMWTPEIWMWQRFSSSTTQPKFFMLCIVYHLQDKIQMETASYRKMCAVLLRNPCQPCTFPLPSQSCSAIAHWVVQKPIMVSSCSYDAFA